MVISQDIAKGSISDAHHADLRTQQFYMAYVNLSFMGTAHVTNNKMPKQESWKSEANQNEMGEASWKSKSKTEKSEA